VMIEKGGGWENRCSVLSTPRVTLEPPLLRLVGVRCFAAEVDGGGRACTMAAPANRQTAASFGLKKIRFEIEPGREPGRRRGWRGGVNSRCSRESQPVGIDRAVEPDVRAGVRSRRMMVSSTAPA